MKSFAEWSDVLERRRLVNEAAEELSHLCLENGMDDPELLVECNPFKGWFGGGKQEEPETPAVQPYTGRADRGEGLPNPKAGVHDQGKLLPTNRQAQLLKRGEQIKQVLAKHIDAALTAAVAPEVVGHKVSKNAWDYSLVYSLLQSKSLRAQVDTLKKTISQSILQKRLDFGRTGEGWRKMDNMTPEYKAQMGLRAKAQGAPPATPTARKYAPAGAK